MDRRCGKVIEAKPTLGQISPSEAAWAPRGQTARRLDDHLAASDKRAAAFGAESSVRSRQRRQISVITLFHGLGCKLFDCLLCVGIGVPTRLRMPSCSRPSRTLRAAGAVARRRAILDCRCARRHVRRAGRDGRMVPIEQKDGTAAAVGRCRDVACGVERHLDGLPATASAML